VRAGLVRATRENAEQALRSNAPLIVFPGGDYDAYRPTTSTNVVDFGNRTGYVRTALEAGVPIVPTVSIGGQENQIFLSRGQWLAKALGLRRFRIGILPITLGVPFGLSVLALPLNLPLPTKIVTEVLEPIDIVRRFGENPDISEVDAHVRNVMQTALNRLAAERRLPLLG
jgi:1-acyl-sn-glycerol-3-phosphate acyltransferase